VDASAVEIVTLQGLSAIAYGFFAGISEGLAVRHAMRQHRANAQAEASL
jgi:hypothetical protein